MTLLLGGLNSMLRWSHWRQKASIGFILTVQGATLFILGWLVIQVGRGRNWARTLLLLFVAGIALEPRVVLATLTLLTVSGAIAVLQLLLQLASFYLLFVSPGRVWYARAT